MDEGPLFPQTLAWVEAAAMPTDEPLRLALLASAARSDRQDALLASFGPDAAAQAAAGAERAVAVAMRRLVIQVGLLRWAVLVLAVVGAGLGGWVVRGAMPVATSLGPMPATMAAVLPLQNWAWQWPACRPAASTGDVEWCLLPIAVRIKRPAS